MKLAEFVTCVQVGAVRKLHGGAAVDVTADEQERPHGLQGTYAMVLPIHRVENAWDGPTVSIHVHTTDISRQTRNTYDLEHEVVSSFVQSYEGPAAEGGER